MSAIDQLIDRSVQGLSHACCGSRSFTSLCYSADGESILAGGQSKFVCIYNIKEQMLMKKFEISCNLSFDAMEVRGLGLDLPGAGLQSGFMSPVPSRSSWTGGR